MAHSNSQDSYHSSSLGHTKMPKLNSQEDWESWKLKSTALFRHKKWDSILQQERPQEPQMVPSPEAVERRNVQIAALYRICPLATPEMERRLPILGPQERRETISEFSQRCEDFDTKNGDLWSFLILHCEGDAEAEVKNAAAHNGQQAWHKLVTRFGIVTTSTRVTCIKEMLAMRQGDIPIASYVTKWQNVLRKLRTDANVPLDQTIEAILFLMSLGAKYDNFHDMQVMKTLLKPQTIFHEAVEYESARRHRDDEGNTADVGLYTGAPSRNNQQQRHQNQDQRSDQRGPLCKFGNKCFNQRKGRCNQWHPGKCNSDPNCTRANCRFTHTVDHVGDPERKGGKGRQDQRGTKRKVTFGQDSNQRHAKTQANLAALRKQHEIAKQRISDHGGDPKDFGLFAIYRPSVVPRLSREHAFAAQANTATTFRFDTGASDHFGKTDLPLHNSRSIAGECTIADGHSIKISQTGECRTTLADGTPATFDVKTSPGFAFNLFSGVKAVNDGCRVVLDQKQSYIHHKSSDTIIPLTLDDHGWTLKLDLDAPSAGDHALVGDLDAPTTTAPPRSEDSST